MWTPATVPGSHLRCHLRCTPGIIISTLHAHSVNLACPQSKVRELSSELLLCDILVCLVVCIFWIFTILAALSNACYCKEGLWLILWCLGQPRPRLRPAHVRWGLDAGSDSAQRSSIYPTWADSRACCNNMNRAKSKHIHSEAIWTLCYISSALVTQYGANTALSTLKQSSV